MKWFGLVIALWMILLAACVPQPAALTGAPTQTSTPVHPDAVTRTAPRFTPSATQADPTPAPSQPPAPRETLTVPNFDHILLIVLENRDYEEVVGSPKMPLFNDLAQQNVVLDQYYAVTHPSLPNYIALVSGSTQGITSDCRDCFVDQPNLADLIESSGRTWKTYQEGMPSPCFLGDSSLYVQKHNPFLYFDSIRLNQARCSQSIVPLSDLDNDLANNQLPNFSFIMPDMCNSSHDCSISTSDTWIHDLVTKLQSSPALGLNSLIVITFDEGHKKNTAGCCGLGTEAGGRVAAVLISPLAAPGSTDSTPYSHYSLLKTILSAWNLPALGQTALETTQAIEIPWSQ